MRNAMLGVVVTLIAVFLVAAGFLGRVATAPGSPTASSSTAAKAAAAPAGGDKVDQDFAILSEIATVLGQDFVQADLATPGVLRDGAIKGIGATVAKQNDFLVIVRPMPDTPAARAGIKAGDLILAVDGLSAEGW